MTDIDDSLDQFTIYEQMFGEKPPIFGYDDDEIIVEIDKAIKTKTPITPINEIIEKELGVVGDDDNIIIT